MLGTAISWWTTRPSRCCNAETEGIIFDQQININFNGKIGEKLGILANFDTKASFNFENALKLNYKPGGGLPALGSGQGLPGMPNLPSVPNLPGVPNLTGVPDVNGSIPKFTPQNENILQGLEVGNISWAVNSQLIPGVQNLFGIKTQLRFWPTKCNRGGIAATVA